MPYFLKNGHVCHQVNCHQFTGLLRASIRCVDRLNPPFVTDVGHENRPPAASIFANECSQSEGDLAKSEGNVHFHPVSGQPEASERKIRSDWAIAWGALLGILFQAHIETKCLIDRLYHIPRLNA